MKITIIGAGRVGSTLGRRWAERGHEVVFGVRDPSSEKVRRVLADAGENAAAESVSEAVHGADVVVLATPWQATKDAIGSAGDLSDKIVVDCTNPVADDLSGLTIGHDTSAAERVADWAGGARVVKAFNTTGSGNMADPVYEDGPLTMFVCGDEADAKATVAALAAELGFDVIDAGHLRAARYLEPLAMLWIHLAYAQNLGLDFGFRVIRR